ncbi:MAG: hypothetical protein VXY34_09785 [Bdellovibrionota bacterium]|jgi:hypothetical protein|nr:hypothetical protein [Bdellovibrionota bacterium]
MHQENILKIEDLKKRKFRKTILNTGHKIYMTVLEETFINKKFFTSKDPLDVLILSDSMFTAGRVKNIKRYLEVFFSFLLKLHKAPKSTISKLKRADLERISEKRFQDVISTIQKRNQREIEEITKFYKERKKDFLDDFI